MMDKLNAHHKRMMARMDSQLEKMDTMVMEALRQIIGLEVVEQAVKSSMKI
jgi:hypothetical protein